MQMPMAPFGKQVVPDAFEVFLGMPETRVDELSRMTFAIFGCFDVDHVVNPRDEPDGSWDIAHGCARLKGNDAEAGQTGVDLLSFISSLLTV